MDVSEPDTPKRSVDIEKLLGLDRPAGRRKSRYLVIAGGAALIAAMVTGWLVFGGSGAAPGSTFVFEPVTRGELRVIVTATGSVQPVKKVDVSSELSGTVRRVLVDYNSKVTTGQPLAELDTDKLRAAAESAVAKLAQARAHLVEAAATVEEKRRDYDRKRTLGERQVSALQDVDAARAAYDRAVAARASAEAAIGVADADLRLAELNLSKACICSPIDGVVLKRNVDPGQTVASSFQAPILFSIAQDLTRMEIQVDVDEADVGKVHEGQTALFSVDAYPERKFKAMLRMIRYASETVQGVVTYKGILEADNSDALLRPGMTATAEIVVEQVRGALLVPNAALRFSPVAEGPREQSSMLSRLLRTRMPFQAATPRDDTGPRRVWRLEDGVPISIPVTTGSTDGRLTVVIDGAVAAGDKVIVDSIAPKR